MLDPLSACQLLQRLACSFTDVSELDPLSACQLQQRLYCKGTEVTYVQPARCWWSSTAI